MVVVGVLLFAAIVLEDDSMVSCGNRQWSFVVVVVAAAIPTSVPLDWSFFWVSQFFFVCVWWCGSPTRSVHE